MGEGEDWPEGKLLAAIEEILGECKDHVEVCVRRG